MSYTTDDTGTVANSIAKRKGTALYAASGFYQSSDKRLKTELGELNAPLETIEKIPTVYFKFKEGIDKDKVFIGTYAQDLIEMFPEMVRKSESGYYVVDYNMLAVIAIKGIKELYKENKELKKELQKIKNLLNKQ